MMRNKPLATIFALTILLHVLAAPPAVSAQQYEPRPYQPGKDVVWVPTPEELVQEMLDMAELTSNDYLIDLGSGDGRIVIAAAKRGARALGIEYNPDMVALSKRNAENEGVSDRAQFLCADIFETDFSRATVLTMYLLTSLNVKLRPTILDLKPGTRVVSHAFDMEDWEPDQTSTVEARTAYLWIVPAKVAGTWTFPTASGDAVLNLTQVYQKVEGSLELNGQDHPIRDATLKGDRISFYIGETQSTVREYSGRINGNRIAGFARIGNAPQVKWIAERRADH